MLLKDMLKKLSEFYPIKNKTEEQIFNLIERYKELILEQVYQNNKDYDFEKLLKVIQLNRTYSTFPSVPEILQYLPECAKEKEYIASKDEEKLIVIRLPNGFIYAFTVKAFANHDLNYYKNSIKQKFGNAKIEIYPKGSVLIGKEVIVPEAVQQSLEGV